MSTAVVTVYLGERDMLGGRPAFDALSGIIAAHPVRVALLLRGHAGFGPRHALQTDQSLSLSEDLPLMWTVVAPPADAHRLAREVTDALPRTLVTVAPGAVAGEDAPPAGAVRLTVLTRRGRRPRGPAALRALTAALHDAGAEAAIVLVGVDGVQDGVRRPGRLLTPSPATPVAVVAVCRADVVAGALEEVHRAVPAALCVTEPLLPGRDAAGGVADSADHCALGVHVAPHAGQGADVRCRALMEDLRACGVPGATVLLGTWGYGPAGTPDGDRLRRVRRGIPGLVTAVGRPARLAAAVDAVVGPAMTAGVRRVTVIGGESGAG